MPLHKGSSQKVVSENISEMTHSETFARGKSKSKKHLMAVAAALRQSRGGKARPPKSVKDAGHRSTHSDYSKSLAGDAMKK